MPIYDENTNIRTDFKFTNSTALPNTFIEHENGGYYGKMWLEAQSYGVEIEDLPEVREGWKRTLKEERF